jgi:hypothetical protein
MTKCVTCKRRPHPSAQVAQVVCAIYSCTFSAAPPTATRYYRKHVCATQEPFAEV